MTRASWLGLLLMVVAAVAIVVDSVGEQTVPRRAVTTPASCKLTRGVAVVDLDNRRHREILRHAWDAIAQEGKPELLHIARSEADANRRAWQRAQRAEFPARDGFERDEYPPAMSDEGGARASIRYVDPHANASAGARMGAELRGCRDGTPFRFERRPGPKGPRAARR